MSDPGSGNPEDTPAPPALPALYVHVHADGTLCRATIDRRLLMASDHRELAVELAETMDDHRRNLTRERGCPTGPHRVVEYRPVPDAVMLETVRAAIRKVVVPLRESVLKGEWPPVLTLRPQSEAMRLLWEFGVTASLPEVCGRCPQCGYTIPPGFRECVGDGSHAAI